MSAMATVKLVLQILLVILSLLLTLLILMHKGKGGGLSDMFPDRDVLAVDGQVLHTIDTEAIEIAVAGILVPDN